jgi:hypothetical protein
VAPASVNYRSRGRAANENSLPPLFAYEFVVLRAEVGSGSLAEIHQAQSMQCDATDPDLWRRPRL